MTLPFSPDALHRTRQLVTGVFVAAVCALVFFAVLADGERHEVLRPVVVSDAVDVMPVLIRAQQTPEFLFQHQPVFRNVATHRALLQRVRMFRPVDVDVPVLHAATDESRMIRSAAPRLRESQAVFRNVRQGVALEVAEFSDRALGDWSGLATAAFAATARNHGGIWFLPQPKQATAVGVSWNERGLVIPPAPAGWRDFLSTSAGAHQRLSERVLWTVAPTITATTTNHASATARARFHRWGLQRALRVYQNRLRG